MAVEMNADRVIKEILSDVSGYPINEIHEDIHIRDELLIDSIKQMEIVARIENRFDLSLEEGQLVCLETLGEFFDLISEKLELSK